MEQIKTADVLHLLEIVGNSIWQRDLVTDEITFTMGVWTALGYPEVDAPKSLDEALALFHPEDVSRILAELEEYLAGRVHAYRSTTRVRSATGEWRWLLMVGGVISRDPSGEPLTVGGVLSDITDDLEEQSAKAEAGRRLSALTKRELEVLAGVANGLTSKRIAEMLHISVRTVESYRVRLMDKLEARNVAGLLKACERAGWKPHPQGCSFEQTSTDLD